MSKVNEVGPHPAPNFTLEVEEGLQNPKRPSPPDSPTLFRTGPLLRPHAVALIPLLSTSGLCLACLLLGLGGPFEEGSAEGRVFQVSPILKGTHASSLGGPPPSKGLN